MSKRKMMVFMVLVISTLLFTGCFKSSQQKDTSLTTEVVSETVTNTLDRNQSVYFKCIAMDGISAYSLTKVLYEQPEIKKNVVIEYTIYNDPELIFKALDNDEVSIGVFPFKLASDILIKYDRYKMVGVVRGENHVLLGISNLIELKGKEIIVFDSTGFDGQYMTTLNRLIYELKALNLNNEIDYTIKTVRNLDEFLVTDDNQVVLVESNALGLNAFESYKTSKNYFELETSEDYQLALLIEDSIVEIYPEIVDSFVEVYHQSCIWQNEYPDRAQAYATQLNFSDTVFDEKFFYYFNASRSIKTIKNLLPVFGYNDLQNQKILNMIH